MRDALDLILRKMSGSYPDVPFSVVFWDGTWRKYGQGEEKFSLSLRSKEAIKRIISAGTLGFGEEYMNGSIRVEGNFQELIKMGDYWRMAVANLSLKEKLKVLCHYFWTRGTVANAKRNIEHHYDIGNDFYSLWLDRTMTYSCAYFKKETDGLETAQNNKYDHICRKLRLKEGETLVDIGCGWGGMMFYAASKYGAKCTGYTLSKNQYSYILEKIRKKGFEGQVDVRLQDYRKAAGPFDKFVSIGMFEHVGRNYYPKFFDIIKKILKPNGIGVLHTIGSRTGEATDPWVSKYIFPGGYIPPLGLVCDNMNRSGLVFYDIEDLRLHYARTLECWITNFQASVGQIKSIMVGQTGAEDRAERFIRMWQLYLNGSAASFKTAGNRLYQIIFSNGLNADIPLTRDYIY